MRLSIITINLNNKEGLARTAASVIVPPDVEGVEWIIVDGGSQDGSVEYIQSLGARVQQFISEKDKGIYHAMNKGVALSKGSYLLFMNSGDQFIPGILTNTLIDNLQADVEYGDCIVETANGMQVEKQASVLSFQSFYAGCICHQATFVRRELQIRFPFDESMRLASCRRFFMDAVIFGRASVHYLGRPIAIYDTSGVSTRYKEQLLQEVEAFVESYLPPLVLLDMQRLKDYDRIARNTRLYGLLQRIHPYQGRRRLFEWLVLRLAKLIFPNAYGSISDDCSTRV